MHFWENQMQNLAWHRMQSVGLQTLCFPRRCSALLPMCKKKNKKTSCTLCSTVLPNHRAKLMTVVLKLEAVSSDIRRFNSQQDDRRLCIGNWKATHLVAKVSSTCATWSGTQWPWRLSEQLLLLVFTFWKRQNFLNCYTCLKQAI